MRDGEEQGVLALNTVILFRRGVDHEDEPDYRAALECFPDAVYQQRTDIPKDCRVIGRYSVLPFYRELELDLWKRGSRLANSWRQHQFIADMREWCGVLGDMTPRLYPRLQDLPETGRFVVKGQTNSRKHQWKTHMYAESRREAAEVAARLSDDSLIGQQEIYARDFVDLVTFFTAMNGMPITEEYRIFVARGEPICGGFYWSSHIEEILDRNLEMKRESLSWSNVPRDFIDEAIRRISGNAEFYTLDVARKQDGGWTVIELNDGQMAGLSECEPKALYEGLRKVYG